MPGDSIVSPTNFVQESSPQRAGGDVHDVTANICCGGLRALPSERRHPNNSRVTPFAKPLAFTHMSRGRGTNGHRRASLQSGRRMVIGLDAAA